MATEFSQVLARSKKLVWPQIRRYLEELEKFPAYCRPPQRYYSLVKFNRQLIADYPQRKGKYFRPTLVLLTARAMGVSLKKAILTAAAMQMSEDWILNHDDLEDNSRQRRGKPTLHRLYGPELAINAGDGLHVLMWQALLDNCRQLGPEKGLALLNEFNLMLRRTVLGQTVEIKWTRENNLNLKVADVLFILESKTGYYTVAGPMRLGAILAGARKSQLDALYHFGKLVGYSFQIRDDLLDLTSDFAGLKKQRGNDIYEGKRTVMLVHLLQQIKGRPRQRLLAILAKKRAQKTKTDVDWVIRMMAKYGSLDYGRQLAAKFGQEALLYFRQNLGFLRRQPARRQLEAMIRFVIERQY